MMGSTLLERGQNIGLVEQPNKQILFELLSERVYFMLKQRIGKEHHCPSGTFQHFENPFRRIQ